MVKKLKAAILPLICVLLVSVFPVLFMFFANASEVSLGETVEPLTQFALCGFGCLILCLIVSHSSVKAALMAALLMLLATNFALLESGLKMVFPAMRYWHTVSLFVFIYLHFAYVICRFVSTDTGKDIVAVICLVMGGLIVFNLITSISDIAEKMKNDRIVMQIRAENRETAAQAGEDMPNVYHLIFDEYAGFNQMRDYYGYDNTVLYDYLIRNNFSVSLDSHNESMDTHVIVTNIMNISYIVDNATARSELEIRRKQGKLFDIMREHGYTVQVAESNDFLGQDSPIRGAASSSAETINGENFTQLCYQNTVFYPFVVQDSAALMQDINKVIDYLSDPNNIPIVPTYTIGYVCFPHQPFLVDENGSTIPAEHRYNWGDDEYYLGQYKYATKLMLRELDNILKNDPDAVIILQSDHGARGGELFMTKFPLEVMNNPLNTVYYRGESIDEIEGLSSVNTVRIVLSRLFNEEYELVDVPVDTWQYK